jgi:hypothetical protein
MSRNITVAIFGNGKTTRSNIEALLGDFKDSVDSLSIIMSESYVGESGAWIAQYAEAQSIPVQNCDDPFAVIEGLGNKSDVKLFLLWDDEDAVCLEAAAFAAKHELSMFDLTDGLIRISGAPQSIASTAVELDIPAEPVEEKKPSFGFQFNTASDKPVERTVRMTTSPEPEPAPAPRAEPEDVPEDYDEDSTIGILSQSDLIVSALEEAGRIFAEAFVDELLYLLKKDGKDDDKTK